MLYTIIITTVITEKAADKMDNKKLNIRTLNCISSKLWRLQFSVWMFGSFGKDQLCSACMQVKGEVAPLHAMKAYRGEQQYITKTVAKNLTWGRKGFGAETWGEETFEDGRVILKLIFKKMNMVGLDWIDLVQGRDR